ncbi:MAG: phasin family protein [Candidatus Competibacter sp.]
MNAMPAVGCEPIDRMISSMARTNQVLVDQFEKLVDLRMNSLKAYVDLGLSQAKVVLKISDARGFDEFLDSQFAVLSFVSHQMVDDGRALAEWGIDGSKQATRLAQENALRVLFKY